MPKKKSDPKWAAFRQNRVDVNRLCATHLQCAASDYPRWAPLSLAHAEMLDALSGIHCALQPVGHVACAVPMLTVGAHIDGAGGWGR